MEFIKFAFTSCAGWTAILSIAGFIGCVYVFCREEAEYRRVRRMLHLAKRPDRAE